MNGRKAIFLAWARWMLRRKAARGLDGVFVSGLDRVRGLLERGPVVLAANHVGWWDGPLMVLVDAALGAEGAFLVDAASVRKMPYLRWIGGIPLDRSSAVAMRPAFRDATRWLAPGRALWIFPQGRERPSWVRPLGLERGHEVLARHAPVVPVSIAYAFRGAPHPAAMLHFGPPTSDLEAGLIDGLDRIDAWLERGGDGFQPLVSGRSSSPERGLGARLLALSAAGDRR
jgi:1-acyl-sn-glycerol-3-phosphate acyltransferase